VSEPAKIQAEPAQPPRQRLVEVIRLAAPYTTVLTLTFIGTCYFSAYLYRNLVFRAYGLSPNLIPFPIQDTISLGYETLLPLTLLLITIYVTYHTLRMFRPVRWLLDPAVDENDIDYDPNAEKTANALRRALYFFMPVFVAFGTSSVMYEHFTQKGSLALFDCVACSDYVTSSKTYTGRILGQDANKTIVATYEGAVIMKSDDIIVTRRHVIPIALKPIINAPARPSWNRFGRLPYNSPPCAPTP
jgi:hypothetical protein